MTTFILTEIALALVIALTILAAFRYIRSWDW